VYILAQRDLHAACIAPGQGWPVLFRPALTKCNAPHRAGLPRARARRRIAASFVAGAVPRPVKCNAQYNIKALEIEQRKPPRGLPHSWRSGLHLCSVYVL